MSITVLRRESANEYALYCVYEKQEKSAIVEHCAKRWPRAEIVYYFNIFDLKGTSRSFKGWYAAVEEAAGKLNYNSDGWIISDFITITMAIAGAFGNTYSGPPASVGAPKAASVKKPFVKKAPKEAAEKKAPSVAGLSAEQLATLVTAVVAAQQAVSGADKKPKPAKKQKKPFVKKAASTQATPTEGPIIEDITLAEGSTKPDTEAPTIEDIPAGTSWADLEGATVSTPAQ